MHKQLSSLLLVSAISCSVAAQSTSFHRLQCGAERRHKGRHHEAVSNSRYAAKTTATASRLIALVSLDYDGTSFVPVDSVSATYSGARGGKYNDKWEDWEWAYDNHNSYEYDATTSSYGSPVSRSSQAFDAADNMLTSTGEEWAAHLSAWRNSWMDTYTYDGAGNRLTEISQMWDTTAATWENVYKDTYIYTTSGKVATNISQMWVAGAWNGGGKTTYTYDAGGKIIAELNESWNGSTSAWENQFRRGYTYDGAGNLAQELYEMWDGSGMTWDTGGRRTYTYDASNRRTEELNESYMSGVWEPGSKILYSNFTGSRPQTIVYQSWDGGLMAFSNNEREHYTYNADGLVTYQYNETWDDPASAWVLDDSYALRFHYEAYTTGITESNGHGVGVMLYPVPASNTISVQGSWEMPEPFTIIITDAAGRICSHLSRPAGKGYTETISIAHLQAGTYLLTVQGSSGKMVRPFVKVD